MNLSIEFVFAFSALLIALCILAIIAYFRPRAVSKPGVETLLDALTPWALKALAGSGQLALTALEDSKTALDALDIKAIADKTYDVLPDVLHVGPVTLPISAVKSIVTRVMWEDLLSRLRGETDSWISRNEAYLVKELGSGVAVSAATKTYVTDALKQVTATLQDAPQRLATVAASPPHVVTSPPDIVTTGAAG